MQQGDAAKTAYHLGKQKKTSHLLHLVLSLLTLGVWVPIWILVAIGNSSENFALKKKAREAAEVKPGVLEQIGDFVQSLFYLVFFVFVIYFIVVVFSGM